MIYRLDYCNAQGDELRLDIQYGSNTVINIEGTGNPFTLNYKGDKDDKSLNFLTSSADISLFETEDFNIDMLKTSSETAISVKYYVNSNLFWQGYVIPDFFSKEITGTPIINMVASDRLSTLKSVSLASDTLPSMITFREIAIKCLQKTGLSLPLKTVANFSNGTGSTTDGFFTSKVLTQRLSDTKGRNISCYDILDSILTVSGSKLMQRGGEWVIINKDQHERGVGTAFNTPTTNITPTGSHAWSEVVHNFSDISVGGRRTIIPVASSVGVYNEFGGSKIYPENYDFSDGLTGWTAVNGFVAGINNKEVIGYTGGISNFVPIYGNDVETNSVINNNASFSDSSSPYLKSENVAVNYPDNDNVNVTVEVNATGVGSYITNSFVEFAVIATNTVTLKQLSLSNNGVFETMTADEPHLHRIKFPTISSFYNASTGSLQVEGALIAGDENLGDYDIHVRIYGSGGNRTSFINSTTIKYSVGGDTPKGNLYKTAQGSNFTKQHDIETTIFGDYIRGGVNGYFYNYPIDDTSLIYNASNELTSLWTTPTAPHDTSEQPLLLHIVRQKARMFSIAHDLLDVSLDIDNFDPLKIFVDCFGRRYVVVASEYDLLRSRARVTVEQIAFNSTIFKQDFIYSYFGEGEKGISSVGGISGGGGGGATGGGLTPEQLEILSWWKKDPDNPDTIFTEMNAYSTKELSAYGAGDGGGDGDGGDGGSGSDYNRLDVWADYDSSKAGWVLSAFLGNDLNTRVTTLEQSAGGGSVTSVGISVPTGLSVANSPITSSGVIAISLQTGYSIPTTAKQGQWDTAYSNRHTHSNKTQLDLITQSNIDVLAKLSIVNGNLQINGNAYATGELSAYGAGDGGGGGGGGEILSFVTSGTGNAVTSIAKSGTVVTAYKNGSFLPLTGGSLTGNVTAPTFVGALSGNASSATTAVNQSGGTISATTGNFSGTLRLSKSTPEGAFYDALAMEVYSTGGNPVGIGFHRSGYSQVLLSHEGTGLVARTGSISTGALAPMTASTFIGALTGNAATASKLITARTIAGVSFDGTANIAIPFGNLASKPTTLGGYGITDAVNNYGTQTIDGSKTFIAKMYLDVNNINNTIGFRNNGIDTVGFGYEFTKKGLTFYNFASTKDLLIADNGDFIYATDRFVVKNNTYVGIGTPSPSEKLHVVGNILATGTTTTPKVIFSAAGWSMEQVGSELQMKHNNVLKMRFTSTGSIVATNEITAFA